jgi:hypothetical protein
VRTSTGGRFAPGGANGGTAGLEAGARAREAGRGLAYVRAEGRLGVVGVSTVAHARVERSRRGRRHAPLRRPMACHGRCVYRWISATWHDPLATGSTGESPPALRSDQRSLRCLGVCARRAYGAYGGLPTWPRTTSRRSASWAFRAFSIC